MSFLKNDTILKWEWPASRLVKYKVVVEIVKLSSVNRLVKSPSFASDIPDPISLKGRVLKSDHINKLNPIELILPKIELGGALEGTKIVLGFVNKDTVVCVKAMPQNLTNSEEDVWIKQLECK